VFSFQSLPKVLLRPHKNILFDKNWQLTIWTPKNAEFDADFKSAVKKAKNAKEAINKKVTEKNGVFDFLCGKVFSL
jgi:hypothetical protein